MERFSTVILGTKMACADLSQKTEAGSGPRFLCLHSLFPVCFLCPEGMTMKDAALRKRPNCFNLLHQLQLMKSGQDDFEEDSLRISLPDC